MLGEPIYPVVRVYAELEPFTCRMLFMTARLWDSDEGVDRDAIEY